jgi:hypothetical protein
LEPEDGGSTFLGNGVTSHKHRCENLPFKKEKREWEI